MKNIIFFLIIVGITGIHGMEVPINELNFFVAVEGYSSSTPQTSLVDGTELSFPYTFLDAPYFTNKKWTFCPENCFVRIEPNAYAVTAPLYPCQALIITDYSAQKNVADVTTVVAHLTYRTNLDTMAGQLKALFTKSSPAQIKVHMYSNELATVAANYWQKNFSFNQYKRIQDIAYKIEETLSVPSKNITIDLISHHIPYRIKDVVTQRFGLWKNAISITYVDATDKITLHNQSLFPKELTPEVFNSIVNILKAPLCLAVDHQGRTFNVSYDICNSMQKTAIINPDTTRNLLANPNDKDHYFPCKQLHRAITITKNIPWQPNSSGLYEVESLSTQTPK